MLRDLGVNKLGMLRNFGSMKLGDAPKFDF